MLPIPADLDLSSYCGAELGSIALGPYAVSFGFYPPHPVTPEKSGAELSVLVEGPWMLLDPSGEAIDGRDGYSRRAPSRLTVLLTQKVNSVDIDAPDTIRFVFANGYVLTVSTDSTGFECLNISVPGAPPYVF